MDTTNDFNFDTTDLNQPPRPPQPHWLKDAVDAVALALTVAAVTGAACAPAIVIAVYRALL